MTDWFSIPNSKRSNSSSDLMNLIDKEEAKLKKPTRRTNSVGEGDDDQSPRQRRHTTLTSSDNSRTASSTKKIVARANSNPNRNKSPKRGLVRKLSNKGLGLNLQLGGSGSPSGKSSASSMKAANELLKASVMAPVNIAAWTGKAVVDAGTKTGQAVVQAGTKAGEAVVDAGTMASRAVVNTGSMVTHGVVDASSAIIDGTTNTVKYGGKSMVKGSVKLVQSGSALTSKTIGNMEKTVGAVAKPMARTSWGVVKGIKQASMRSFHLPSNYKPNKSKWEEGIQAIDELLDPDTCVAYQYMTPEQRQSLQNVKKLLLKGTQTSQASKMQHVPAELIFMQSDAGFQYDPSLAPFDESMTMTSMAFSDVKASQNSSSAAEHRKSMHSSSYILEEYAGIKDNLRMLDNLDSVVEDEQEEPARTPAQPAPKQARPPPPRVERSITMDSPTASLTDVSDEPLTDASEGSAAAGAKPKLPPSDPATLDFMFVPPEFTNMDKAKQVKLYEMLQWETINKWDFNIFELNDITNGKPMLFAGWAILAAPHAQQAMAKELGIEYCNSNSTPENDGYYFMNELRMPPDKLYNFIKVIEQDYTATNAYHCAIHGADVLQSLHTLIQMACKEDFMNQCSKIQLFSVLLSALCHDVAHFGTTNAYHNKLQTELSVIYNDSSVLENWHVSHAFSRMLDLDLTRPYTMTPKDAQFSKFPGKTSSACNILCNATAEQFATVRKLMVDAILHTDMSNHFQMVNSMRAMLMAQDEADSLTQGEHSWQICMYMLHCADISGQAKDEPMSQLWTERCFEEFFAQGDQEASLGIPVSPNCDRYKVRIPESQVGFIKFVVEPAFEVLGEYIPFVQVSVLPIIHSNMVNFLEQQQQVDAAIEEQEQQSEDPKRLSTLDESISEHMAESYSGFEYNNNDGDPNESVVSCPRG